MTKSLSGYLNLLRVLAAYAVFFDHISGSLPARSDIARFMTFTIIGHDGVIVFFVLSGYLIGYAACERETTGVAYIRARFTRIASVLIPALMLSVAANLALIHMPGGHGLPWKPYDPLLALTFLTQSGNQSYIITYDGPFWSLNYEVWYYVIFGLAMFAPGRLWKVILPILAAIIAGPNILMLSPIWLMGAAVYFLNWRIKPLVAKLVFITTITVYAVCKFFPDYIFFATWAAPFEQKMPFTFYFSNGFLWDWIVGLLTALNILAFRGMNLAPFPARFGAFVTYTAGMTFSLYLYHGPIIFVVQEFTERYVGPMAAPLAAGAVTLGLCMVLAHVTEHQRDKIIPLLRAAWRALPRLPPTVRERGPG